MTYFESYLIMFVQNSCEYIVYVYIYLSKIIEMFA